MLEILPEYKEAFFTKLITGKSKYTGSFIGCFEMHPTMEQYEETIDELLILHPNHRAEIAQKILGDWWYICKSSYDISSKVRMDSMVKKFPEYKKMFEMIYKFMFVMGKKDAMAVLTFHEQMLNELTDSNELLFLSRTLNKENCPMMASALNNEFNFYTFDYGKCGKFIEALTKFHEYLTKIFPSLFSFPVSCIKHHGIFSDKSKCIVNFISTNSEKIDCIYEENLIEMKKGQKIIIVKIEAESDWVIMGKNYKGEVVCGRIEKSELLSFLVNESKELMNPEKSKIVLELATKHLGTNIPQALLPKNQIIIAQIYSTSDTKSC